MLAVPTIAMGGTLPAAARAATRDTDVRRQDVAAVYALNTLGAVLGCIVATFWLLEILGTRATIWLAAASMPASLAWRCSLARCSRSGESGTAADDTTDWSRRT